MKASFSAGEVTIKMTPKQLGIIRYALATGVDKLNDTASFMSIFSAAEYRSAKMTAKKAVAAQEQLETAVEKARRSS